MVTSLDKAKASVTIGEAIGDVHKCEGGKIRPFGVRGSIYSEFSDRYDQV